jgi:hypothetical protein
MPYYKKMLNSAQTLTQDTYQPYSTNTADYVAGFSPLQQQAQTSAAGLQVPGQFAPASQMAGIAGIGQLGSAEGALGYGAQGAGYGQDAANVGSIGGLGYGAQSADLGMQAAGMAGQGYGAGAQYAQQATDPNSVSAYMSPYMQNVMAQQVGATNRQYDITGAQQQGQATQAGAFGGTREALMASENERNRNTAIGGIYATGLQNAYTAANANQQFGANLGLQGMQAGNQAMQTGLQGYQQGLSGVNTALQGYQQGMAGSQVGLQGVQGAQQGYAGASNTAATLGNLGTAQLGAQTGVMNTQNTIGGQQQAQQQQAINQAILNYQNAQQYPYMQLGFMSDLLHGTQTGNTTQTQYQAQPGMASQIGGLAATGLGAYAALKAEGGAIKDKGYAKGGIVGYKLGGSIEESMRSKLEDLDRPRLQAIIQKNESAVQTGLAKEVLATKLAKGGIVAFANGGSPLIGGIKNLYTQPKKMSEFQEQAGPVSGDESLKNMALNQAEGFQPPMPTSEMTPVKATPFNLDQAMAEQQQDVEKLRREANVGEDVLIAEDKKRREEQLGPDTATIEYRKKIMDERANAPDEQRRQMGMRLMEFGANWASTPGAPLVAGMRALKEGLPGFMEDTKANKKAMKDIDASIYALDRAARLEDEGYLDRATAKKEKARELFAKAAPAVIDASVKKETLTLQEQSNKDQKAYQQGVLANQEAELKQRASQFDITSGKPTEAGMKEQAIQAIMKEKGIPYGTAYGQVEALSRTTKDPALGYRVAMAKAKLDNASDIYNAALGADAKQKAYDAYQIANKEFETLQRAFDPTGEYGTTPPPSLGPNVNKGSAQQGSGVNQATLDLFTGGK